ncbi:MAG TPA: SRPBCC family protein [Ramlibacter sp.]|nr:SRPBCC family protein [Aquabacterium sp.]HYF43101.1 SRPBCC family protein [Ramlibacter sp.]
MRLTLPAIAAALAAGGYYLNSQRSATSRYLPGSSTGTSLSPFSMDTYVEREVTVRPKAPGIGLLALAAVGGYLLWNQYRKDSGLDSNVEESIDLNVPVSTAYNQWTQFEEFPKFMASVEQVTQVDDTHLHWRANVAGKTKEWDAEITEQIPDERIAWRSTSGVPNGGVVTFHKLGNNKTRVMLQMDYHPETIGEKVGDAVGGVKLTAKGNLKRFKQLVESRGTETGAWRGTVTQH